MNFATATIQHAADSVESDCNPTQARRGTAWLGEARQAWLGEARHGMARRGAAGMARRGAAGMAGEARRGQDWTGSAWLGRQSTNRSDRAGYKWIAKQ